MAQRDDGERYRHQPRPVIGNMSFSELQAARQASPQATKSPPKSFFYGTEQKAPASPAQASSIGRGPSNAPPLAAHLGLQSPLKPAPSRQVTEPEPLFLQPAHSAIGEAANVGGLFGPLAMVAVAGAVGYFMYKMGAQAGGSTAAAAPASVPYFPPAAAPGASDALAAARAAARKTAARSIAKAMPK